MLKSKQRFALKSNSLYNNNICRDSFCTDIIIILHLTLQHGYVILCNATNTLQLRNLLKCKFKYVQLIKKEKKKKNGLPLFISIPIIVEK